MPRLIWVFTGRTVIFFFKWRLNFVLFLLTRIGQSDMLCSPVRQKWNQVSLMYILIIIWIKNKECAHCGLYPQFMVIRTGFCSYKSKFHCNVWVFTWRTCQFVGFVMRWLKCLSSCRWMTAETDFGVGTMENTTEWPKHWMAEIWLKNGQLWRVFLAHVAGWKWCLTTGES